MARRRRRLGNYPTMSEEMMTLTSIIASLDTVGKHLSAEKERKESFREKLILSDRDMKWRSEEAQKSRDAAALRESFQYGFGKLGEIEKSIEKIDEDIVNTGASQAEWESLDYINKTDGFKEYSKAVANKLEEDGFEALNRFASTKDNMEAISSEFRDLSTELKYKKFLMGKIKGFATELGATLPQLYEVYRDKSSGAKFQTEYDRMVDEFRLDDAEEELLFKDLSQNEMFSDIMEDKVLQMLVRREVAPLYSSSIAKYKEGIESLAAVSNLQQINEAREAGDVNQEFALYGKGKTIALSQMQDLFAVPTYAPDEKGTKALNERIKDLSNKLAKINIEGGKTIPEWWGSNIAGMLAAPPQEQYANFGRLLSDALSEIERKGKSPKGKPWIEEQVITALIESGSLGGMNEMSRIKEFVDAWKMYERHKANELRLLESETGLTQIKPDVDKALEDMTVEPFDPEGSGYHSVRAEALGYEEDEDGHLPSIDSTTGMVLKGKNHPTWDETVKTEADRGYIIIKGADNHYYTVEDTSVVADNLSVLPDSTTSTVETDTLIFDSDSLNFNFSGDSLSVDAISDSLNIIEQDSTFNDTLSPTIGDSLVSGAGDSTEVSNMFSQFNEISNIADIDMPEEMIGYEFIGYSRGFNTSDKFQKGVPMFKEKSTGEIHGGVPKEFLTLGGSDVNTYVRSLRDFYDESEEYLEIKEALDLLEDKRDKFKNTYARNYDKDGRPKNKYTEDREKRFNLEEQELEAILAEMEMENPELKDLKFASE